MVSSSCSTSEMYLIPTLTTRGTELPTLPEHMCLPFCTDLSGFSCCSMLSNFHVVMSATNFCKTLFGSSLLLFVMQKAYVLFVFFVFIYAYCCWCHLTVTRRITIVEHEQLTLPELLEFALFDLSQWGSLQLNVVKFHVFISVLLITLRIARKTLFCPSLLLFVLWEIHVLFMFFLYLLTHTGVQHDFPVR